MKISSKFAVAAAVVLAATACADLSTANRFSAVDASLAQAFATVPVGFTSTQNSFDSAAEGTGPWFPGGPMGLMGREPGPGMGRGMGPMIGGNMHGDMLGGKGLGRDFGRGRFGDPGAPDNSSCVFSAATGRLACAAVTRGGLTINRSLAYVNAAGAVQSAFDSLTTDRINTRVAVSGTMTRRDSAATVLTHSSDRTVSGLASGSTRHTVNGTSAGRETTTGTRRDTAFTASRDVSDTTSGLVVPVVDNGKTYPIAGTVIRNMKATRTIGGTTTSSTRREVVTYDGSATAKLVVTQDGTTKTCTMPLPFGRPTCQ